MVNKIVSQPQTELKTAQLWASYNHLQRLFQEMWIAVINGIIMPILIISQTALTTINMINKKS